MEFKDHFSKQSKVYSLSRPRYPKELFEYLRSLAPSPELVWDCATGNGQAAISLAEHFEKVIATDASSQQIDKAFEMENIEYLVAPAEEIYLEDESVDLITVATALHWFDLSRFFREAQRVLKPGGILAAWSYAEAEIEPEIDLVCRYFEKELLWDYWAPGAKVNWFDKYESIEFPFEMIETPRFRGKEQWNIKRLMDYFESWSAVQTFKEKNLYDPVEVIRPELEELWGEREKERNVEWELILKVGRKN